MFASDGGLGSPATVTAGFKPALWACAVLAAMGALAATAMSGRTTPAAAEVGTETAGLPLAA